MHKLKLELDELAVETFETERADAGLGTVRAHDGTVYTCASCLWTCGGSCPEACATN